ncbi:FGFR1 oncogene partner [Liparis tanakae]|uniref:FGFR1 oncogene partner n=1 Tax=Liparis tanakae TaxID=230148 RepID=A0A4Z2F9R7_9TELE|nr:FGFR1 oncogene partner [Liparis tanakae]
MSATEDDTELRDLLVQNLENSGVLNKLKDPPPSEGGRLDLDLDEDPEDGDSFFDDPLPKPQKTYGWKVEASGARGGPAGSLSEAQGGGGGGGSSASEQSHSRKGAPASREKDDKTGSLQLDGDVQYDDDFNSHRSDFSRSELSIGEEIEEVSIEGPDSSNKVDDSTQDLSVSQLSQSHGADYMEEVA